MQCPKCQIIYYSFYHQCEYAHTLTEPMEQKYLGNMSMSELDAYYKSKLDLTPEDRQLMRDMLIGVD